MNSFCFWARASDTSLTTLETEDFGRPTVSPMSCRKLPLAKKRNATRICSVGDSAWFLVVCRCRSFSRISVRNSMESRPNLYLLRSSSSEKSSRKISCSRNFLSRIFGGITGISKSAILFVLTNFDQFYSPISEFIDLSRCVKFNPWFILWIVLIVLSGTEINRRINFIPGLRRFNPRLTLIGFPGTGA